MIHQQEGNPLQESFRWVGDLVPEEREGRFLVKGKAIHPCKTHHPDEWPEVRVYLEEELKASAPTLTNKPLTLDHSVILEAPNKVLKSAWEDGAVEYVAEVSKEIYDLVKSGEIRHVSIEYDWHVLEKLDGIAPRGLQLTGLSLLKQMKPGDPTTSVQAWESVVKKLKDMGVQDPTLEDRVKWLEEEKERFWYRFNELDQKIEAKFDELNAKIETLLKIVPVFESLKPRDEAPKDQLAEAQRKIRDLTEERDSLKAKLSIGEAVIQPGVIPQIPSGYLKVEEVLAILPKDVPYHWGAGPHELVRRLRTKCSQSIHGQPQLR